MSNDKIGGLVGLPHLADVILTERLLLRPFRATDLDDVYAYQRMAEVVRYLGWGVLGIEEARKHLAERVTMNTLAADGDWLVFAVERAGQEAQAGRVVGEMIVILKSIAGGQLEVGWIFHPDVQGKGIATEAARAILTLCFDTLGGHRVFAKLDPRNTPSAKLCERIGMRLEGRLREAQMSKGEWTDTAIYAVLGSEREQA